jgi:hypothetical protein
MALTRWTDDRLDDFKETMDRRIRQQADHAEAITESLRREAQLSLDAAKEAVRKSEATTERRFEQANEWRQQSADREATQRQDIAELTGTFMPREVVEAKVDELNRKLEEIDRANTKTRAEELGAARRQTLLLGAATFVILVAVTIANVLTATA